MIKEEELYKIGKFNKTHGVKGELILTFTDDSFSCSEGNYFVCRMDGLFVPFFIESYMIRSSNSALIKLDRIDSAEEATIFVNTDVYYPKEYAREPDEEDVTWDFFIGFKVTDTSDEVLGEIAYVDTSTANTLFVINRPDGKEWLVPAHEEFIAGVDVRNRNITLSLPEGFLSLNEQTEDDE